MTTQKPKSRMISAKEFSNEQHHRHYFYIQAISQSSCNNILNFNNAEGPTPATNERGLKVISRKSFYYNESKRLAKFFENTPLTPL